MFTSGHEIMKHHMKTDSPNEHSPAVLWKRSFSSIVLPIKISLEKALPKWLDQHSGGDEFVIPCPWGLEKLDVCDDFNGLLWLGKRVVKPLKYDEIIGNMIDFGCTHYNSTQHTHL